MQAVLFLTLYSAELYPSLLWLLIPVVVTTIILGLSETQISFFLGYAVIYHRLPCTHAILKYFSCPLKDLSHSILSYFGHIQNDL